MEGFSEMTTRIHSYDPILPMRCRPRRSAVRLSLLACCGLASLLVTGVGCHSASRKPAVPPQPEAPAVPQDANPNTVSVDISRSLSEDKFRRDVTPEQRVRV